jgi:hypothetical protein
MNQGEPNAKRRLSRLIGMLALIAAAVIYVFLGLPGLITKTVLTGEESIGTNYALNIPVLVGVVGVLVSFLIWKRSGRK